MIVATAGHIDHGKTSLVKALTGIDTDRLPEEKARGMSIDLGFAYVPVEGDAEGGSVLGFVDVPGHDRFIANMLAGIAGIDHALLAIAADDGPMPQTVEHLAILDLLGVAHGTIAITKIDRVSPERVSEVTAAALALIDASSLTGSPVFPVSATGGEGIAALRAHLHAVAGHWTGRAAKGRFRLAIDRSFVMTGSGVVVTGSALSGSVAVDDGLVVSPAGIALRVRAVRAQNRVVRRGVAGDRLAVNIAGPDLSRDAVGRGDWLVAAEAHRPTVRLDARLRLLAGEQRPLAHWTPVHVHLGAADVTGRIAVLDGRRVEPGGTALVQLVLDRAVAAVRGDSFILRDRTSRRTLAGGTVLDPEAPARGRRRAERLGVLAALERPEPDAALAALLEASTQGVDLGWFARIVNADTAQLADLWRAVPMVRVGGAGAEIGFLPQRWAAMGEAAVAAIAAGAFRDDARGLRDETLRQQLDPSPQRAVFEYLLSALAAEGRIARAAGFVRPAGSRPRLSERDADLWQRVEALLLAGGVRPPSLGELAAALALPLDRIERFLLRAAALGLVTRVAKNRFFPAVALSELAQIAEKLAGAATDGGFEARDFRDQAGIGRNLTIEVLEFFDAQGLTRRDGDRRWLAQPAARLFPPADGSP